MENGLFLTLSFIGGSAVASVVWAIIINIGKTKANNLKHQHDAIISEIAEICADMDNLVVSFNSGILQAPQFKTALASKIEVLNRKLRPNMHTFEVYYVKYLEMLIQNYRNLLQPQAQPQVIVQENADAFSHPDISQTDAYHNQPQNYTTTSEQNIHEQNLQVPSNETSYFEINNPDAIQSPVEETLSIPGPQIIQDTPHANHGKMQAMSIERAEPEVKEDDNDAYIAAPSVKGQTLEWDDEFGMETIMDLDMSRLQREIENSKQEHQSSQVEIHEESSQPIESADLEIEHYETVAEGNVNTSVNIDEYKEHIADAIDGTEEEVLFQENNNATVFEDESVEPPTLFEVDPDAMKASQNHTPVNKETAQQDDKKDISITGDDVADKIDAFFFGK